VIGEVGGRLGHVAAVAGEATLAVMKMATACHRRNPPRSPIRKALLSQNAEADQRLVTVGEPIQPTLSRVRCIAWFCVP
jgi:hypothetical protein